MPSAAPAGVQGRNAIWFEPQFSDRLLMVNPDQRASRDYLRPLWVAPDIPSEQPERCRFCAAEANNLSHTIIPSYAGDPGE